ncbi:5-formyltetrahydrofolate cyclo-ligase [Flavobacteriaceae bacterium]|jgi:5-formyltetrahydrofolate cyclo-ligase|nr:5-formyltetrahydrofolate cyclo-ligase [Flavobacteriaceae bacterium]MDA8644664.1 5-formyltetrahydrofolate cyclo-ligase [Flavobacteriaceae bacterium]MDA8877094.1 5-formyltetrahydrofolate cyclo-ligase [Flavobacteriaceae bacterium]MDA9037544.1 5-formyltetrahydrofolate cyclo-ligase [Flavobacteriaceae bacterium]MDC0386351.1 5-formyltetrahydrofolate cyclo-ligase [Flavobacteriaceae bacterium]
MNLQSSKTVLRALFLEKRLALSKAVHEARSFTIANHCLQLPIWDQEYIHLFLPIEGKAEIDTTLILTLLQGRDKQVVLPKVNGNSLQHILLTDSTKLRKNQWGILEPEQGIEVPVRQLDVVFIPLLAWDKKGQRVGYGKGFYDSFLADCKPAVIKIGLSLFEGINEIEGTRPEDVQMDYCVHPEGITAFAPPKV